MATYDQLLAASEDDAFRRRVKVACFIAADTIRLELDTVAKHAERLTWAKTVYSNPDEAGRKMVWAVIAANKASTQAQITGATDAVIQTAVDSCVNVFAIGG